ncbi:IS200/IS605 family transposase [Streptomyces sp. NPDC001260]|uniref:IS200/IS605 family transposase n=1 Tax=Streptomyces sp. NPDC001260 TaxID=3364551 RepID=UPI003688A246
MRLVFVTKYRRGVVNDEMLTRCEEIMRKVCEDFEAELKEFNGERDHVHLLINYPPMRSPSPSWSTASRASPPAEYRWGTSRPKAGGEFTGWINRAITHGHLRSPSYFSASCGGAPLAIIRASTSSSKNARSNVHVRAVLRCIQPRRERRGFLQEPR